MSTPTHDHDSPLPHADEDLRRAAHKPDTPQTRSPSYRLAFADPDFLLRDELRPVRLQLELWKPELLLAKHAIESTIVVFGSARLLGDKLERSLADPRPSFDADAVFAELKERYRDE